MKDQLLQLMRKKSVAAKRGYSTRSVHSGEETDPSTGSVVTPIYETSTFAFPSTKVLLEVMRGERKGNVYTRWWNPTNQAAEKKIADLESAQSTLLFSSGMAAISTAILTIVKSGDHVVSMRNVYGGTFEFMSQILPRINVEVTFVDADRPNEIEEALRENTKLVYLETPTNPTLKVVDIRAVKAQLRRRDTRIAVDSTFATPYNQQPLKLGADIVIHSATKYLGGHADVTAGVVASERQFISEVYETRKLLGGTLDPHAAWLLIRGLKTFELRMRRHNENGMKVARFLSKHPMVKQVFYPGLPSHLQYRIARRQMRGFGGMLSFIPRRGSGYASRVLDRLKMIKLAPSLGGVETLATQPWMLSHFYVPRRERLKAGISDELIRMSIGIENADDIIADLKQALSE
jgi:cystathionine beta-lyase/cystathionine gamma-synthase